MGIDETLFGFAFRALRRAKERRARAQESPSAVKLADFEGRLSLLASAVAECRLEVAPAETSGAVRPPKLYLPVQLDLGSRGASEEGYVLRTVLDAALSRLAPEGFAARSRVEEQLAALALLPAALSSLARDLPQVPSLFARLSALERESLAPLETLAESARPMSALAQLRLGAPETSLSASLSPAARATFDTLRSLAPSTAAELRALFSRLPLSGLDAAPPLRLLGNLGLGASSACVLTQGEGKRASSAGREKKMRPREQIKAVDLGQETLDENPLVHSFEKLHTAEEYRGGKKRADGADELDEHGDALDELDIRELTRSGEQAHSVFHADLDLNVEVVEDPGAVPSRGAVLYDEWDARRQRYLRDHCSVFVTTSEPCRDAVAVARYLGEVKREHAREIRSVQSELQRMRLERAFHPRQVDGPDLDIDAAVERATTLRAGHTPNDKVYMSRRRHAPELAALVLVDASASAESWVLGQRVIDVAKASLVVLGTSLEEQDLSLAFAAFASHTRMRCDFRWLKHFHEPCQAAWPRVVGLEPDAYTRIGPALRHATWALGARPEKRKLLLLLSDGKATDYDRYEGRHGIGDVHKAVLEAERDGVHVLTLAIDRARRAHLPAMFGRGRFEVLSQPALLPRALAAACAHLLRA